MNTWKLTQLIITEKQTNDSINFIACNKDELKEYQNYMKMFGCEHQMDAKDPLKDLSRDSILFNGVELRADQNVPRGNHVVYANK